MNGHGVESVEVDDLRKQIEELEFDKKYWKASWSSVARKNTLLRKVAKEAKAVWKSPRMVEAVKAAVKGKAL